MSITVDKIQLEIAIKHDKARQEIAEITQRLRGETKELRSLEQAKKKALKKYKDESHPEVIKATQAYEVQSKKIADLRARKDELRASLKVEGLSIAEVRDELKKYSMTLSNLTPGTEKFNETKQHVDELKKRLKELNQTMGDSRESLAKYAEEFNHIGFAITNALAIKDRVVSWAEQYVDSYAKMDDAMTDVMKYTGQTKREVEEMNETFRQMTTRTPREELNALAGAAGRLGITARKDIEGFVDAADKINVALGDDLGEGAIDQIGKLTMVFGEDKTKGLNGAMLATGSAINVLGASSSANTGFITDFTSSMAGMAVNAGIAQTDIMGYASALSQAGIEGQTASGVFAQLITKMFTDPARFAKAAGLDIQQFTNLLKTDANAAILQFLNGLKQRGGFDALAPALKSLKMQGTQAVPVISSLINKMDELRDAQQTARQAYDEGTSIIDEFNNANSSAAARLEIARKAMNDAAADLGQRLMPIVEGSITAGTSATRILAEVATFVTKNAGLFGALAVAVATYTVAVNAQAVATKAAAAAQAVFNVVTKANPMALLVSLLAGAVALLVKYRDRLSLSSQAMGNFRLAGMAVKRLLDMLISAISGAGGKLVEFYNRWWLLRKAVQVFSALFQAAITSISEFVKMFVQQATGAADVIEGIFTADWDKVKAGVKRGMASVGDLMKGQVKNLWDTVKKIFDRSPIPGIKVPVELTGNKISEMPEVTVTGKKKPAGPTGNFADTEDDKERRKREARLKKERQEAEALAKAQYQEELTDLKEQWQKKQMTDDTYHEQQYLAEADYLSNLMDIRRRYGASQSDLQETQNQQMDAVIREANRRREQQQRDMQTELRMAEMAYNADVVEIERDRLGGQYRDEKRYQDVKLQAETDYQQQRISIIRKYNGDATAEEDKANQLQLQQGRTAQERKAREYEQGYQRISRQQVKSTADFEQMRSLTDAAYQQQLISYEDYERRKTEIAQQESQQRQQIEQEAFSAASQLLSSTSSLFSALQSRETAQVDAKYKRLIAAAKKKGKDTAKLEEQQEAEKMAIQKKYAQKQFRLQVLQIIAATAQSIANVWKSWAAQPAVAAALSAVAAAQGAIQLATAKAQADQAAGLYKGGYASDYVEGYTRRGSDPRKQAGVIPVHQNEFVANHRAVANPAVRPVLDVIDRHQRRGDIALLNATRLLDEAYGRGRYRGGYVAVAPAASDGGPASPQGGAASGLSAEDRRLLEQIARNTARTLTVRSLRDEIAHEEQLERNAHR